MTSPCKIWYADMRPLQKTDRVHTSSSVDAGSPTQNSTLLASLETWGTHRICLRTRNLAEVVLVFAETFGVAELGTSPALFLRCPFLLSPSLDYSDCTT